MLEKNNAGFDEIETNSDLAVELLRNSAEDVIELLRRNSVTGAFLVLEGSPAVDDNGGTVKTGCTFGDGPLLHLPGQLGYPDRAGSDRHYQGAGDPDGF